MTQPRRHRVKQWLHEHPWVRWLIPVVIVVVLAVVARDKAHFLAEGFARVTAADPAMTALCFLVTCLSLVAMAKVMSVLLRAGGTVVPLKDTTSLVFAANAWSTTLPGGQALAAVLAFTTMRSWGASVVLCSWQIVVSGALSTMWLVSLGLAAIIAQGATIPLWSLAFTLVVMVALSIAVYWATQNPRVIARWAKKIIPRVNRLLRHDPRRGLDTAIEHIYQLRAVKMTKAMFATAALFSLLNWLLDIVSLGVAVVAVTRVVPALHAGGDEITIAGVALAYVTSKIAGTVQATPGGLGPVEAALMATLVAVGLPAATAIGVVFVYRMTSFVAVTLTGWLVHAIVFTRRGITADTLKSSARSDTTTA